LSSRVFKRSRRLLSAAALRRGPGLRRRARGTEVPRGVPPLVRRQGEAILAGGSGVLALAAERPRSPRAERHMVLTAPEGGPRRYGWRDMAPAASAARGRAGRKVPPAEERRARHVPRVVFPMETRCRRGCVTFARQDGRDPGAPRRSRQRRAASRPRDFSTRGRVEHGEFSSRSGPTPRMDAALYLRAGAAIVRRWEAGISCRTGAVVCVARNEYGIPGVVGRSDGPTTRELFAD